MGSSNSKTQGQTQKHLTSDFISHFKKTQQ